MSWLTFSLLHINVEYHALMKLMEKIEKKIATIYIYKVNASLVHVF